MGSSGAAATPEVAAPTARGLELAALKDIAACMARRTITFADRVPVDPVQRTGMRLIGTDRYDVWLLRWPPGAGVSPHDHGDSAGAFSVVDGELTEVRWLGGATEARSITPGKVITIERGIVHDVIGGTISSLSVHVYSPPLTSMSYYGGTGEEAVGRLEVDDSPLLSIQTS